MADLCHRRKTLLFAIFFLTLLGYVLVQYVRPALWMFETPMRKMPQGLPIPKSLVPVQYNNTRNTTVLVWYWAFGRTCDYCRQHLQPNVCLERYGIPNCILSDDRSLFPQADYIIFHNRELIEYTEKLPEHLPRPPNQAWVWFSRETPPHNGDTRFLAAKFNYTLFYRRDSDFFMPFGWLVPRKDTTGITIDDVVPKEKTHLACWVVSNFQPHHERTKFYYKLKEVMPVEVWGGAVKRGLNGDDLRPTISRCYFYLSFENSIFPDYISEKVWINAFEGGAIPVVLGPPRKNYEEMLPKDSFIHVNDFKSVGELAEFLKNLSKDKERYASYFRWKLNYTTHSFAGVEDWLVEPFCRVCIQQNTLQRPKVYQDLHGWQWRR
ncbi:alpha-(1,3)-fucosyltransferase 7-like [Engraulis encrasicolus]|uniref:alpha-(1,3)-fucosyltransferase 7-like n=1 Tax=Engraulis encrasicolus TaxID=184585 RepID=UPI002FD33A0E